MQNSIETAIIPITETCNLNCSFCFASAHFKAKKMIDLNYYERKLTELKFFGLKQVILTGGEPTLHPNISEMVDFARRNDISVQLLTNATLDNLFKLSIKVNHLVISIDGTHSTHDLLRGKKGALDRTVKLVKSLPKDTDFSVTMTVSEDNIDEIEFVYNLAIELEAKSMKINPIVKEGRAKLSEINDFFYDRCHQEIKRVYSKYWFKLPLYTSVSTYKKMIENVNSLVTNLFSSIWVGENDLFSFFPLPTEEGEDFTFLNLDRIRYVEDFQKYIYSVISGKNPNEVMDQHLFFKETYKTFTWGNTNV